MKKICVLSFLFLFLTSMVYAVTVNLPKTGQTRCYDSAGVEILCAGTGQDGDIQAGVAWPKSRSTESTTEDEYDPIDYSEIGPKLREIEKKSSRVRVEVMGQSAGGRDLYLVTITSPDGLRRLGHYRQIRRLMTHDPERAQDIIEYLDDFKLPFFVNGGIHGIELPGVDACMELIEHFAYDESAETLEILENFILLINPIQNPDGRVNGTRHNGYGIDLNRDFITQSQPETQALTAVLADWNPLVLLDLHGFMNPMWIEPGTPPHNPNYEYDLYLEWALAQALAMQEELKEQLGIDSDIAILEWADSWDDWAPIYTPQYAMYHGSYGHCLETPYRDERGVEALVTAVMGALKFAVDNKQEMVMDQIEIFRRGFLDLPQQPVNQEILDQIPYDQFEELMIQEFPEAYVIALSPPLQQSTHQPHMLIDFLLANDIQVEEALHAFTLDNITYPKGTCVVWMNQPKRGLANTILSSGWDLSAIEGLSFYSKPTAWSHPLLWGVRLAVAENPLTVKTTPLRKQRPLRGSVQGWPGTVYAYLPNCNQAIRATNDLIATGTDVFRLEDATGAESPLDVGTFIFRDAHKEAIRLALEYGLDVFALMKIPDSAVQLEPQRIAVYPSTGSGLTFSLRELGFTYQEVTSAELNAAPSILGDFDVLIFERVEWRWELDEVGYDNIVNFLKNGGNFIGMAGGVDFADNASLLDFALNWADGDGIVKVVNSPKDPITAGLPSEDYAYLNSPYWFSSLGNGVNSAMYIKDDENFFVSGYWSGWSSSGARGKPVVIHSESGPGNITLLGISPTFGAHPKNMFRVLANALFPQVGLKPGRHAFLRPLKASEIGEHLEQFKSIIK